MDLILDDKYKQYFPADMDCSEEIKAEILKKIEAFNQLSEDLPVLIIHDIRKGGVLYMTPYGLSQLKTDLKTLHEMGDAYFQTYFNPDDIDNYLTEFMKFVNNPNNYNSWFTFFQQVKTNQEHVYDWYLSASKVIITDAESGKAIYAMTIALQLNEYLPIAPKLNRLLEENEFIKKNVHKFSSLTKTEKKILQYIAQGFNFKEIAGFVNITADTYRTHRKNLKRKLEAVSDIDLIKYAHAFNL